MSQRPSGPPEPNEELYSDEDLEREDLWARERGDRGRLGVSDFVRRAIENTVGSVQTTGSISKEALQYLLQQGDRGRREMLRIVAAEVGQFLRDTDLSTELIKVLTGVQVELSANIKFKPAEGAAQKLEPKAEVNFNVSPSRRSESPPAASDEPPDSAPETPVAEPRTSRASWLPGDPKGE